MVGAPLCRPAQITFSIYNFKRMKSTGIFYKIKARIQAGIIKCRKPGRAQGGQLWGDAGAGRLDPRWTDSGQQEPPFAEMEEGGRCTDDTCRIHWDLVLSICEYDPNDRADQNEWRQSHK